MVKPDCLKKNDKVGIIAPAGVVKEEDILQSIQAIEQVGLSPILGKYLFDDYRFFAASDEKRASDLQEMLDNPEVKAIFCARGGYGMGRIIDQINLDKFKIQPKWVVGFSDVTVLHLKLSKAGFMSLHAPVFRQFSDVEREVSIHVTIEALLEGTIAYEWDCDQPIDVNIEGRIVGGNLSLIVNSMGTQTEIDTKDKILFIEDVGESIYRVDRMLNQLERSGKLTTLKAVLIGDFTDITETSPAYNLPVYEMIKEYFQDKNYPVLLDFPVGHDKKNMPVITNSTAEISSTDSGYRIRMS